jgi:hypothetical protein
MWVDVTMDVAVYVGGCDHECVWMWVDVTMDVTLDLAMDVCGCDYECDHGCGWM